MIAAGTAIGTRYVVHSYIASGGMQDVYRALDTLTDQEVALKTPQAGQASKRFHRSAQLASRVNHYSIAKTTDYFEFGGSQYLIEELVEGETLESATLGLVPQVDPHLAAHLLLRLAKGVCASHNAGVAHRDLKPGNVLVAGGQSFREIKITDFGIATLTDEFFDEVVRNGGDLTRSTSGTIQGALPYMAPEMIFRKAGERVGIEADIWSLGAMMFRLLTGLYPFEQGMMVPVNVSAGRRTAWPSFMTENPQFAPLATSLQGVVETCLQTDPSARPSAASLVATCEELCFFFAPRAEGIVTYKEGAKCRARTGAGRTVFFHTDSVYGAGRVSIGSRVIFSDHPGEPFRRAHPVVLALTPAA